MDNAVAVPKEVKDCAEVPPGDDARLLRKRAQMKKELDGLIADNEGNSERDRMLIWRKIQKYIARNDDIANE